MEEACEDEAQHKQRTVLDSKQKACRHDSCVRPGQVVHKHSVHNHMSNSSIYTMAPGTEWLLCSWHTRRMEEMEIWPTNARMEPHGTLVRDNEDEKR